MIFCTKPLDDSPRIVSFHENDYDEDEDDKNESFQKYRSAQSINLEKHRFSMKNPFVSEFEFNTK